MTQTGAELTKSSAELFQANLAKIGIQLKIDLVDTPTFTSTFYGDAPAEERPHVMPWSWWPDYNDAWNQLYPIVSCDSWGSKGGNGGYYCNKKVDELLAQAKNRSPILAAYDQTLAQAQHDSRPRRPLGDLLHAAPLDHDPAQRCPRLRLQPDQHRPPSTSTRSIAPGRARPGTLTGGRP